MPPSHDTMPVAIIGGGPAGLMAAERLSAAGHPVTVFDAMASVGRKFLLAGKGGMNLTHAEPTTQFISRYRERSVDLTPLINAFGAEALRNWVHALGIDTFIGSSQRVFPTDMKAAPLLHAWLKRLRAGGVAFAMRHRWLGWTDDGSLRFATVDGERLVAAGAVVLALGGGSWKRLGSDGAWVHLLSGRGIPVAPLRPANCGFDIDWSAHFRERHAGEPLKSIALSFTDAQGHVQHRRGECLITQSGMEGSLMYALSAPLRDAIEAHGDVTITLDLAPGKELSRVEREVSHPRGARSMSSHLKSRLGIYGAKAGLLHEVLPREAMTEPLSVAAAIKALPLRLTATRPIDEAISSAGGVGFEALDGNLMLRDLPGVFCAGEMLDWEAPTGGYLLTACFASGRAAGDGAAAWLKASR